MEDPVKDIKHVVRGLVEKPTLKRQAAVIQKYFTEDVKFYHFYVNTYGGIKDLTALYQLAEIFLNYQGVEFHKIMYDEGQNSMALLVDVFVRPWTVLSLVKLRIFVLLELQDVKVEGGKTVKKIKVQKDSFERAPMLLCIPIFGQLYDSDNIRAFLGGLEAAAFNLIRNAFCYLLPATVCQGVMGVWDDDIADATGLKAKA